MASVGELRWGTVGVSLGIPVNPNRQRQASRLLLVPPFSGREKNRSGDTDVLGLPR
jgi:hypothetical protein